MTRIAVIGLGYIGLPTAIVLARAGAEVIGVDVSDRHVESVNCGLAPFVEEGMGQALAEVVAQGRLRAQGSPPQAEVYIIAVPTPVTGAEHDADLSYVEAAARAIAPRLTGGELIVLESTCPPGTTARMAQDIVDERPDLSLDGEGGRPAIHVAHCPERVLPGRIMEEMVANDRIIGGLTPRATDMAAQVYSTFCRGELLLTDATTAEMTKLAENSFRDVNIAFANELAILCEQLGIDVWELIDLANHHPRVNILRPGPGVGGHCIAVDPWFIISALPDRARLIRTAREVNDARPGHVVEQVARAVTGLEAPVIAALGLAFKADVDDMRQSPAIEVVHGLAERLPHATVLAVEPNCRALPPSLAQAPNVRLTGLDEALERAGTVVLLVDHREIRRIASSRLEGRTVIDTRGVW